MITIEINGGCDYKIIVNKGVYYPIDIVFVGNDIESWNWHPGVSEVYCTYVCKE